MVASEPPRCRRPRLPGSSGASRLPVGTRPETLTSTGAVIEREIVGIVWHEEGSRIFIQYSEGEPDGLVASEQVADQLASEVGLAVEARAHGTVWWTRQGAEPPERPERPEP